MLTANTCCWCCEDPPETVYLGLTTTGNHVVKDQCPSPTGNVNVCSLLNGLNFELPRSTAAEGCNIVFGACSCSDPAEHSFIGRVIRAYRATTSTFNLTCPPETSVNAEGAYLLGPYGVSRLDPFPAPGNAPGCTGLSQDCAKRWYTLTPFAFLLTRSGSNGATSSGNGCSTATTYYPHPHKCFWVAGLDFTTWQTGCSIAGFPFSCSGIAPFCNAFFNVFPTFTDRVCCKMWDSPAGRFRLNNTQSTPPSSCYAWPPAGIPWANQVSSGSCQYLAQNDTCDVSMTLSCTEIEEEEPPPPPDP